MSSNLFSRKAIKALLNQYGAYPSKGLGQNFLIDKSVLKKIIKAANLTKKDVVLEIGPGIGNLTRELAYKAKRVIAVEKDPKLVKILKETLLKEHSFFTELSRSGSEGGEEEEIFFDSTLRYAQVKEFKNIEIIQGDILKIQDTRYKIQDTYKIVANLPFYIVAPVIRKFLQLNNQPRVLVLMVQKEVAQRICARPPDMTRSTNSGLLLRGSDSRRSSRAGRGMNLLAVSVQFYAKPEIISYVSKKSFWPQPKVDSAILKITPLGKKTAIIGILPEEFFKVVKAGFSQPRQMLLNNLVKKLEIEKEKIKEVLQKNKISLSQRAETLTVKDWVQIAKEFSTLAPLERFFNKIELKNRLF